MTLYIGTYVYVCMLHVLCMTLYIRMCVCVYVACVLYVLCMTLYIGMCMCVCMLHVCCMCYV